MRCLVVAAFVCLAWQASPSRAYTCNDNHYVDSSGHVVHSPSCGEEHQKRTAECRDGSLSFQNTTVGRARSMAASRTGIKPSFNGCRPCSSLRLNAFGYNPTHLVQLTSTTSP
jgi:predicted RNA-binding Zn-ribbon protein involved in translation (DUF1610 family)